VNQFLNHIKGVHPGIILDRELKKRGLSKGPFALSIKEFPQTLSAITKGKRNMNTSLALRIEEALGIEEGYFMTLQVFHDIKMEKRRLSEPYRPDLSQLRRAIFWDTRIETIDWARQKRAVIDRVWERGTEQEKQEIARFYGKEEVETILNRKNIKK
jgi:plasmid maintenance system antidote protein VapI